MLGLFLWDRRDETQEHRDNGYTHNLVAHIYRLYIRHIWHDFYDRAQWYFDYGKLCTDYLRYDLYPDSSYYSDLIHHMHISCVQYGLVRTGCISRMERERVELSTYGLQVRRSPN